MYPVQLKKRHWLFLFHDCECTYAGMRRVRAMREYERWDSYSAAMGFVRFVVVVFVSETRVFLVSLVAGNVIGLYHATVFITIRARKTHGLRPAPLKNTIWFITNRIADVVRCRARSPFLLFERKVCPDKCTRHSAMRRSCLNILHDICIFKVSFKITARLTSLCKNNLLHCKYLK